MLEQNVCLAAFAAGDDLRGVAENFETTFEYSIIFSKECGTFIAAKLGVMTTRFLEIDFATTSDDVKKLLDGIVEDYEKNVDKNTTIRINKLTEELHKLRELQARRATK